MLKTGIRYELPPAVVARPKSGMRVTPPSLSIDDATGTYINGPISGSIVNDQGRLVLETGLAAPVGLIPITPSLFLRATEDAWPYVTLHDGLLHAGPFGFRRA